MDPEVGKAKDSRLDTSDELPDARRRATIATIHDKPLPLMTVHEAIEEICATGTGAWACKCVFALLVNGCIIAIETVINTYLASCVDQAFALDAADAAIMPSATFLGAFLGSFVLSPLADIYGRRLLMLWMCGGIAFFCLLSAVAPTFHTFLACRFLCGFCEGPFMVASGFVAEFVSTERRGMLTYYVSGVSWGLGTTIMNILAWLIIPHYGWRTLLVATAFPVGMNMVQVYMLVESPRWLVSQGRVEEAVEALDYMAKGNGTVLPCSWLLVPRAVESTPLSGTSETTHSPLRRFFEKYLMLFTSRAAILCTLVVMWACVHSSYYAVVFFDNDIMGVRKGLGACQFDYAFNIFVGSAEITGAFVMIPLLDNPDYSPWLSGRVGKSTSGLFVCTVAMLLTAYGVAPTVVWAAIARGLICGNIGVQIIQAAELFDSQCRATCLGFLTSVGMLSATAGPYWVFSGQPPQVIGTGIACVMSIGMMASFLIPETAGQQMAAIDLGLQVLPSLPWLPRPGEAVQGSRSRRSAPALFMESW